MSAVTTHSFEDKKAFELSFASFKIAERTTSPRLRALLEERGTELLDAVAGARYPQALQSLKSLEYLVRLCAELAFVEIPSARVFIGEVQALSLFLNQQTEKVRQGQAFLFPSLALSPLPNSRTPHSEEFYNKEIGNMANPAISEIDLPIEEIDKKSVSISKSGKSAEIRQTAIIDKIRVSGDCHLKDLRELLPDVSERMIRYDLQKLIEDGTLERVGGGGPSSYYRLHTPGVPVPLAVMGHGDR